MYPPIVRNLRLKRMYLDLLGDRFIRGGRCLVATSQQEKRELIGGGIDAARVEVRRNGIELPSREPEVGKFRRERGISSDAKVILFLGRLVSKKSPDMLLEAFANWRANSGDGQDAVLVLAGPGEGDGFLAKLRSLVDRLGIREQVLFIGPLYDDAKWSAYRDADVFVLPSQNENFGNTAGEAAACGHACDCDGPLRHCALCGSGGRGDSARPCSARKCAGENAAGPDAARKSAGGMPRVCGESFVGRAAGSDGGNVPALRRAVRRGCRHQATMRAVACVSRLRSVARAGDESESILDCFDARFRSQRTRFHF